MRSALPSHSLVLVATLALASCAHDPPMPPPPPAPVLADVAAVAADTPAEPEPMADGPAILSSVCTPVWSIREDGSRRIACTTHAPWDTRARVTEIGEHRGDPLEVCELVSIARGAFTRANAREVLLAFADCNRHGPGTASAFAIVLEDLDHAQYRPVVYQNDLHVEHCERTEHAEGRQILYCESTKREANVGTSVSYAVVDFAHPSRHLGLVATLMRHDFDCAYFQTNGVNTMPKGYVWMRTPTFHTEHGKLVIDVERTYAPRSPTLEGRLGSECQKDPNTDGLAVLPPPQKYSLTIEPERDSYVPTPSSKTLLDQWARELTDTRLRSAWAKIWLPGSKK
jgi:hypothetical protein